MNNKQHQNSVWHNEAASAALRELCAMKLATQDIADRLSIKFGRTVSKGAVCGRLNRLGISNGYKRIKRADRVPVAAAAKAPVKQGGRYTAHMWKGNNVAPALPAMAPVIIDLSHAVGMLDHHEGQCRWPIDVPQRILPFLTYCGAPVGLPLGTNKPCPYCLAHWRLSLGPAVVRKPYIGRAA